MRSGMNGSHKWPGLYQQSTRATFPFSPKYPLVGAPTLAFELVLACKFCSTSFLRGLTHDYISPSVLVIYIACQILLC